jgi:hypothetical protein
MFGGLILGLGALAVGVAAAPVALGGAVLGAYCSLKWG